MEVALEPVVIERRVPVDLVAASIRGDREAFAALVEPSLAVALGAALIVTRSHADASDAVQDALLTAWQGLDRLRDPQAFPAWSRTLAVRAALRVVRRRGRVVELDVVAADPASEAEVGRTPRRAPGSRSCLDRLAPDDRALLTMRHLWDAPVDEVAEALGVPAGTVKSRTQPR